MKIKIIKLTLKTSHLYFKVEMCDERSSLVGSNMSFIHHDRNNETV